MSIIKPRSVRERPGKRTSMISLRIEPLHKQELESLAREKRCSLSSLIQQVLKDFLEMPGTDPQRTPKRDKRRHPRKDVLLPARLRVRKEKEPVEHDVLIRNISAGGAYTEFVNGQLFGLFQKYHSDLLELAVRLPGSREPVVFECEPKRFHITEECLGVGLHYTKMTAEKSLLALARFLS